MDRPWFCSSWFQFQKMHLAKSHLGTNQQPISTSVFYDDLPPGNDETASVPVLDASATSKRRNCLTNITNKDVRERSSSESDDVVHCVRAEVVPVSPSKISPKVRIKGQLLPSLPRWRPREECEVLPEENVRNKLIAIFFSFFFSLV